jgi:ATP-dependent DNA ligase
VESLARLRSRSRIIDGEAVACDDNGLASFERIRYRQHDGDVFLYAFDLIELNGDDLRRDLLQVRKATLQTFCCDKHHFRFVSSCHAFSARLAQSGLSSKAALPSMSGNVLR